MGLEWQVIIFSYFDRTTVSVTRTVINMGPVTHTHYLNI